MHAHCVDMKQQATASPLKLWMSDAIVLRGLPAGAVAALLAGIPYSWSAAATLLNSWHAKKTGTPLSVPQTLHVFADRTYESCGGFQ